MENITIRRASREDLDIFRRLSSMLFESDSRFDPNFNKKWPFEHHADEYFRSALSDGICLIAEHQGEPIGFFDAVLQKNNATATVLRSTIGQIYVVPSRRRVGVARQLMCEYLSWCSDQNVAEVVVGVFERNDAALAFYESFGIRRWIATLNGKVDELSG